MYSDGSASTGSMGYMKPRSVWFIQAKEKGKRYLYPEEGHSNEAAAIEHCLESWGNKVVEFREVLK
jgi:hypothetical protein